MSAKKTRIVRFELDPNEPARLSDEEKARFDAIRDEDIDYSDIPELDDEWFIEAQRQQHPGEPVKLPVKLWVDERVIAFFRERAAKAATEHGDDADDAEVLMREVLYDFFQEQQERAARAEAAA